MASKKFLINIDLNKNQLLQAVVQNSATPPATPALGQIYYDTALSQIGVCINPVGPVWSYGGDITNVVGTSPIQVAVDGFGVATVSILAATALAAGSMSASDFSKLAAATSLNTASTLVYRDASGNFAAGAITANSIALTTGTISSAPLVNTDITNKLYVDDKVAAVIQGMNPKAAVRVASSTAVTLAAPGSTIDGVTMAVGNRVLINGQNGTTPNAANGIYVFNGNNSPMTRATDMDSSTPINEFNGAYTFVQEGTYAGVGFVEVGDVTTVGTDPLIFVYFNSIGGLVGGAGITISGNTVEADVNTTNGGLETSPAGPSGKLQINLDSSNPEGPTMQVTNANELAVTDKVALTKFKDLTLVANVAQTITHNFGTTSIAVYTHDTATGAEVQVAIVKTTINAITVESNQAATVRVTMVGSTGYQIP